MKRANSSIYYLLLAALCVAPSVSHSAIRVSNISRNNKATGYQQVNAARYQDTAALQQVAAATPQGVVSTTPVVPSVPNAQTDMTSMERCASIYPTGEFAWTYPTAGRGVGGAATCTSVVKMLAVGAGDRGEDVVLATVNLAAGDSIRCNIDEFPAASYSQDVNIEVSVPNNQEPTMDDVIQTMNQEQKQNAALKIISTSVISALAGNAMGDNAPGSESLLGGGKEKLTNTAVGALGGAALATASVYSGKVAGDMIMSAGVNAVAGSVIGNIAASGDSVLRIEDCTDPSSKAKTKCLWGNLETTKDVDNGHKVYLNKNNLQYRVCKTDNGTASCEFARMTDGTVPGYNISDPDKQKGIKSVSDMTVEDMFREQFDGYSGELYCFENDKMQQKGSCEKPENESVWIPVTGAKYVTSSEPAIIVGVNDKSFGWKRSEWAQLKKTLKGPIYRRSGNGIVGSKIKDASIDNFSPVTLDADDGNIIDMDNKARLKGTLAGAGVGAGMGAFTAYQGAQSEIEERWVTAVREYKDSLQKFVCMTGNRFLAQYNDTVSIPPMPEPTVSE